MKALIVGAGGQLGQELQRRIAAGTEVVAVDKQHLDITDLPAVLTLMEAEQPQVVINCAAYTAVDGAEAQPDLAVAINAEGAGNLARGAQRTGARLLHVSTDFVFDGESREAYQTRSEPRPLGIYGHSKLAGERRVQEILPLHSVIVRTSWLYSCFGANFVQTMLRLMNERQELSVVNDQVGSPTWAGGLAEVLWRFAALEDGHGIYHWADGGSCSWYDFACAIHEIGMELGLVRRGVRLTPITTRDYPTPARRPAYSVLDTAETCQLLGTSGIPWRQQLREMLEELSGLNETFGLRSSN